MQVRIIECALAVTLISVAGAQTGEEDKARAVTTPITTKDDDSGTPLSLELRMRSRVICGSFRGLLTKDNVLCLPFKALLDQLGIFVWLNLPRCRAYGKLAQPDGPMELDMLTGKAAINGKTIPVSSASAVIVEGDMYVDVLLLEKWLPIKFEFNSSKLEVSMQPTKALPIESQWERTAQGAGAKPAKAIVPPSARKQLANTTASHPVTTPATASDGDRGTPLSLELRLRSKVVSGSFRGLLTKDNVLCLPMKALLDQLGIFVWLNLPRSRAYGKLAQPEGPMELDLFTGKAAINGKSIPVSSASAVIVDGDMYVDVRLLEKWLPIKFEFDSSKLEVSMLPTKVLPIEAEWERAAQQAGVKTAKATPVPPTTFPPQPDDAKTRPVTTPSTTSDDDSGTPLVLELRIRSKVVSDSFQGILTKGNVLCLPFKALLDQLGIFVWLNLPRSRAYGKLAQPEGPMEIDMLAGKAAINGKTIPLGSASAVIIDGDMYVDVRLLEKWLPIKFDFNYSKLEVSMQPTKKLPIESEWERAARQAGAKTAKVVPVPTSAPRRLPYKLFSVPFVDFTLNSAFDPKRKGGIGSPFDGFQVSGSGDLLFMSAKWFVAGSPLEPLQTVRLQLGQTDLRPILLGGLHAREFSLGDIWSPALPFLSRTRQGRGFAISSYPSTRSDEFSKTSITGFAIPGWEVELYRNEQLLDYGKAEADGTYRFNDVPLQIGANDFRVVAYGPNGQVREEQRHFFIGSKMAGPSEKNYRLAVLQQGNELLANSGDEKGAGSLRWLANYEQGTSGTSSIAASATGFNFLGRDLTFYSLGVRQSIGKFFGSIDFVGDSGGSYGLTTAVQSRINGINFSAEAGYFPNGFASELIGVGSRPIKFQAKARADGLVRVLGGIPISYQFTLDHTIDPFGKANSLITSRFITNRAGVTYSNSMRMGGGIVADTVPGAFSVKKRIGPLWYHGELNYSLGGSILQGYGVGADWMTSRNYTARLALRQQFGSQKQMVLNAGFDRRLDTMSIGLSLSYSTSGAFTGALFLSSSIGQEPRTGKWALAEPGLSSTGLVSVRVFLDENGSGRFDKGDLPLEGVRFLVGRRRLPVTTDRNGIALLTGLTPDRSVDLQVDPLSLDDPTLMATREMLNLVPRAGSPIMADFAMVQTGEIEGVVTAQREGNRSSLAGLTVILTNESGVTVDRSNTGFDGAYLFEKVLPGIYTVSVDTEQAAKLGLSGSSKQTVTVSRKSMLKTGVNFALPVVGEGSGK